MAGAPLPPMEKRKDVLLERWHSHTAQCKTCQKVGPHSRCAVDSADMGNGASGGAAAFVVHHSMYPEL